MRNFFLLAVLSAAFACAQQKTVTVTAVRSVASVPDQASIGVTVVSASSAGIDDIVNALQGSGISAANLTGLSNQDTKLRWDFDLPVPFSQIQGKLTSLAGVQQTANKTGTLTMIFGVDAVQSSAAATPACPIPDLMSDARTRAQALADAGGFFLGPVTGLSTNPASTPVGYAAIVVARFPFPNVAVAQNCTLTVTFGLN